jgi:hypothetical protein
MAIPERSPQLPVSLANEKAAGIARISVMITTITPIMTEFCRKRPKFDCVNRNTRCSRVGGSL